MWDKNLIMGLSATKRTVSAMLKDRCDGTSVFRLSANNPGCLALGVKMSSNNSSSTNVLHTKIRGKKRTQGYFSLLRPDGTEEHYNNLEQLVASCEPITNLYPDIDKKNLARILADETTPADTVRRTAPSDTVERTLVETSVDGESFVHDVRYKSLKSGQLGAYGNIAVAVDEKSGNKVAIRKLKSNDGMQLQELRALHHFRESSHILSLEDLWCSGNSLYAVHELHSGFETLSNAMKESGRSNYKPRIIVREILHGLAYIHSANVAHGNLTPENILLGVDSSSVKISGLSKSRPIEARQKWKPQGKNKATWYPAPETILDTPTGSAKTDIWAVGNIAMEVFTGKTRFKAFSTKKEQLAEYIRVLGNPENVDFVSTTDGQKLMGKVLKEVKNERDGPQEASSSLSLCPLVTELVGKMLKFNPDERINCDDALKCKMFGKSLQEVTKCSSEFDFNSQRTMRQFADDFQRSQ